MKVLKWNANQTSNGHCVKHGMEWNGSEWTGLDWNRMEYVLIFSLRKKYMWTCVLRTVLVNKSLELITYNPFIAGPVKINEPHHDKTNKMTCTPSEDSDQISLCPVWPESSLCAHWVTKNPRFLHADSEDWSDWADAQADLNLCWAHRLFCWFCHAVVHLEVNTCVKLLWHIALLKG